MFNESLAVFEVWVEATGEHREALERWKAGAAPAPGADAVGSRRRRRRRRRGERPAGQESGEPARTPPEPTPEGSSGS